MKWRDTLMFDNDKQYYDSLTDCIFYSAANSETGEIPRDWDYFTSIVRADHIAARIFHGVMRPDELEKDITRFENVTPKCVQIAFYDWIISTFAGNALTECIAVIIRARQKYTEPEPPPDRYRL